jgi:hypothetical protein
MAISTINQAGLNAPLTLTAPVISTITNGAATLTLPTTTGTVALTSQVPSDGPAFSAYQSTDQNVIDNSTWTKLNFQTETFDTNSNFASSRFTPTVAGYYQLNLNCTMASTTGTQFMFISIYKNGSNYIYGNISQPVSGQTYARATASTLLYLNGSTDYVEGYVFFQIGNYTYAAANSIQFSGCMVRGA